MIGDRIRELRKQRRYSQAQLAKKLNVTQGAVSQWENEQTVPAADQLVSIASLFGVTVDQLLGRENEPAPATPDEERDAYADIGRRVVALTAAQREKAQTVEAKIISAGVDRMPEADRERALTMMKLMFAEYADYFKED